MYKNYSCKYIYIYITLKTLKVINIKYDRYKLNQKAK